MIVREDERLDYSKVPESRGIPEALYRVAAIGLLIIFAIGASVCLMSGIRPPLARQHVAPRSAAQRAVTLKRFRLRRPTRAFKDARRAHPCALLLHHFFGKTKF